MSALPQGLERRHPDLDDDAWALFCEHFTLFPWEEVRAGAGFELGCGAGRWSSLVVQATGSLVAIEPDPALAERAARNLAGEHRMRVVAGDLEAAGLEDSSMDFGFALDAIQSAESPAAQLAACVRKLKPGAPFLLYLCYALDNRPAWFRAAWQASDLLRRGIQAQPPFAREALASAVAAGAYWPLARLSRRLERLGVDVSRVPLSTYRTASLCTMRQGASERFAAEAQARFTATEVRRLMRDAGLTQVQISDGLPYWTALGRRA